MLSWRFGEEIIVHCDEMTEVSWVGDLREGEILVSWADLVEEEVRVQ